VKLKSPLGSPENAKYKGQNSMHWLVQNNAGSYIADACVNSAATSHPQLDQKTTCMHSAESLQIVILELALRPMPDTHLEHLEIVQKRA